MNDYTFIVNPKAGRGAATRAVHLLKGELDRNGKSYKIFFTQAEGDGIRLAREATTSVVVAVGGDGTVNEVANGLMGTEKTLGIVPSGSGNDLPKSILVPINVIDACKTVLAGIVQKIDVGTVTCSASGIESTTQSNHRGRFFVNGVGIGFDAAVAEKTRHMRYLSGTLLYLAAVFRTLGTYRAPLFNVSIDGQASSQRQLLIAIGNGKCAGGGFYLTPSAEVDDGKLDVCLIDNMNIPGILNIMPRVMRGRHTGMSGISLRQGRTISVRSENPFFVHADGEIVGRMVNSVEIGLVDKALRVIVRDGIS